MKIEVAIKSMMRVHGDDKLYVALHNKMSTLLHGSALMIT